MGTARSSLSAAPDCTTRTPLGDGPAPLGTAHAMAVPAPVPASNDLLSIGGGVHEL